MSFGIIVYNSSGDITFASDRKSLRLHAVFTGTISGTTYDVTHYFAALPYVPPVCLIGTDTAAVVVGWEFPESALLDVVLSVYTDRVRVRLAQIASIGDYLSRNASVTYTLYVYKYV